MKNKTKKKNDKLYKLLQSKIVDFLISLVTGLIVSLIGALFSFWLMKTYGFSFLGG